MNTIKYGPKTLKRMQGESLYKPSAASIAWALATLHLSRDRLFDSIRQDIERGLLTEARHRLDFVDLLLESVIKEKTQKGG